MKPDVVCGQSFPLGATVYPEGVNFCVFSKTCEVMELLLFDDVDDTAPARVIQFDPQKNKTFDYWHVFVPGIGAGQLYGYRAYGPFTPDHRHRFDGNKVLLDPYTQAVVVGPQYSRKAASQAGDNCAQAMKSVVADPSTYDWGNDTHPRIPYAGTVIYEMHVAGFTRHPSSGVSPEKRGTYAGLVEKIPYLKALGITAVELLPIQQFDEQNVAPPLKNYWGYDPIAFFAPHAGYSLRQDPLGPIDEFRDMVKAFHQAGIEVILDVVFNHTAEGDCDGPTLSFRGLENQVYYMLEEQNPEPKSTADELEGQDLADSEQEPIRPKIIQLDYSNYSGCGNTLNGNHSIVRRMIIDCLHYWVSEMHVDGFRFDLASVLSRDDESGLPLDNPPLLWSIDSDPVLAGTKIIAEAWDAAGLYQVGSFVGHRWAEWNGHFRDDVRRFIKGDAGTVTQLAARIVASPDIYPQKRYPQSDREPNRSINFVTCHDGFTLNDLVSYNQKHNEANGEDNRDGSDYNCSWNCSVEGPADDPEVEALRLKQIKNFLTVLLVSQGTPMLLMGDEVRRGQAGNNNVYCQDNELSWFDWNALEQQADMLRFVRGLIHFIQDREIFSHDRFLATTEDTEDPHIVWHGVCLGEPDWDYNSHSLAFTLRHLGSAEHLHIMLNAYWEPLAFELPPLPYEECWHRIVDTALPAPEDFSSLEDAPPVTDRGCYWVQARSSVVLMAKGVRSR